MSIVDITAVTGTAKEVNMEARQKLKDYLAEKKVNYIMKEMLQRVCIERPDDVIEFMIDILRKFQQNGFSDSRSPSEKDLQPVNGGHSVNNPEAPVSPAAEEQEEEEPEFRPPVKFNRGRRQAVFVAPPRITVC